MKSNWILPIALLSTVHCIAAEIVIDADHRFQTMRGFGASIISYSQAMGAHYRDPDFQDTYINDLRFNIFRMGLSPSAQPEVETPEEIDYRDFLLSGTGPNGEQYSRAGVALAWAEALTQINPDFQIIASVWSAPAWMKTTGETTTGSLRLDRVDHYAKWIVEWARLCESRGLNLSAVSIVNEPQSAAFWDTMYTPPNIYPRILAAVAEALEEAGFGDILLFGSESLTRKFDICAQYASNIDSFEGSRGQLDAFATHPYIKDVYVDDLDPSPENMRQTWRKAVEPYGWEYWMTEGGSGDPNYDNVIDEFVPFMHDTLAIGDCALFAFWQVTEGGPSIHAFMVGANHTVKSTAIRHYSRYITPGMQRIWAGGDPDLPTVAFVDPETGDLTLVTYNQSTTGAVAKYRVTGAGSFSANRILTTGEEQSKWLQSSQINFTSGQTTLILPPRCIVTIHAPGALANHETAALSIDLDDRTTLPRSPGSIQVPVSAEATDRAWFVESEDFWLTVHPATGNGPGTFTISYSENPSASVSREGFITVNGRRFKLTQSHEDPAPASFWAMVEPDAGTGARNTSLAVAGQPGIGWIDDSRWPFVLHYGLGTWMYFYTPYGNAQDFYAWRYDLNRWIWGTNAWGWYFVYPDDGWFAFP